MIEDAQNMYTFIRICDKKQYGKIDPTTILKKFFFSLKIQYNKKNKYQKESFWTACKETVPFI